MLLGLIITVAIGVICIWLGLRIWKKQQITLLHDYHYKNVKECDIKAYTEANGKATCIIGLGCILMGVVNWFTQYNSYGEGWGLLAFAICFLIGATIFVRTQKKYNGSIL